MSLKTVTCCVPRCTATLRIDVKAKRGVCGNCVLRGKANRVKIDPDETSNNQEKLFKK